MRTWSPVLLLALSCGAIPTDAEPLRSSPVPIAAVGTTRAVPAAAAMITWAPTARDEAPARLTGSDGTGLELVRAEVRAVVQEPLAFTEMHLSFQNPEDRVREGRFEITLPDGAAISRFAMKIDGEWQEGEVVEKQRARRIYEDFLHRRQDPAILEQDAGNTFRARVFPIPAGGVKDLIISWSQEVVDGRWSVPLAGLPALDLDVDVKVVDGSGGTRALTEKRANWAPDADLEVSVTTPGPVGLSAGEYHVVRVAPPVDAGEARIRDLTVLLDTSASRALSFEDDLRQLGSVLRGLPASTPITMACFDQEIEVCWTGKARAFDDSALRDLLGRGALGASDLEQALRWAAAQRKKDRLLIVSDGVPTAGLRDAGALEEVLASASFQRADVLTPPGSRDVDLLTALVRGDLPDDGVVAEITDEAAARRLTRATRSGIEVSVPGAAWVWPRVLDGVQPGDDTLIYAVLPDGGSPVVHLDGTAMPTPSMRPAQRPLLERAAISANLRRLQAERSAEENADQRAVLTQAIVDLSTEYRVLTEDTALLVLETEQDYVRYDLARDALADILVVAEDGVALRGRDGWTVSRRERRKAGASKREEKAAEALDGVALDVGAPDVSAGFVDADQVGLDPVDERFVELLLEDAPQEEEAPAPEPSITRGAASGSTAAPALSRRRTAQGRVANRGLRMEAPADIEADHPDLRVVGGAAGVRSPEPKEPQISPWEGRYADVRAKLDRGDTSGALIEAWRWRQEEPLDVVALLALGEALAANGDHAGAARAYGSILDLFPSRADLRRMAGERLESLGEVGLDLAIDTYTVATEQRPDHLSGHRLLAFAHLQAGDAESAFVALETALSTESRDRTGVRQVLAEDLGLAGAAWIASAPEQRDTIVARAQRAGAVPPTGPSTRFVLTWETDANDVDLHVYDAKGGHAFFSQKVLPSGGRLLADVTNGFGPEAFVIAGPPTAGPYTLKAHYYSRGPMGYGMGALQVVHHDGAGRVTVEARPFVVMVDQSTVDLGTVSL